MSKRSQRKEEHLALAQMFFDKNQNNSFDQMHLIRPALPESKVELTNLKINLFNKTLNAPFFIEAMTGGSDKSKEINRQLANIANQCGLAMALGSASILTKEPEQLASFLVARQANPTGVIIANVNPLTPVKTVKFLVKELDADALQIHLNTVQEAAMPEGERDFTWLANMQKIRQELTCPIIVKEVGFGFDLASILTLKKAGFSCFDIGGMGGTNFAQIENHRNQNDFSYLANIGLNTVVSAKLAQKAEVDFFVSGGVRQPLDILKGLVLGGKMVGIANRFLVELMQHDAEHLIELINSYKEQLAILLALYGKNSLADLPKIPQYYDLALKNQLDQLI